MGFTASEAALARPDVLGWWCGIDKSGEVVPRPLDISPAAVMDASWCSVRRISLGTQPHRVHFCRPSHTLLVFDEGSFVDGERRINGVRTGIPGPLDHGIDIVPANVDFFALANSGSNIAATLISIYEEEAVAALGINSAEPSPLLPALNLEGDLLSALAARLRQAMREEPNPRYLETLIALLFQEVLRTQDESCSLRQYRASGGLSPRTRRLVRDFLHENLDKDVDLDRLANYVGLSRFHFSREFKASFGVPPHKYLLNLRIQRSSELLRETIRPITDIALDVGFSCSSDFSRAFKQIMSCCPREFRSLNRPNQISGGTLIR
ncbi:helix-turn-helix transcriptional regulator [Pseudomonas putida]|uniref:AraC family transcriptional regulator n=1 Tax=Pseudomonas putida TaxID=303 RepID=A0AAW6PSX0_PSEPU|nr:AraC family transcriptional regulator [Pseudomonas putida]MDF3872857.1 AraC family transcriptional regulator [Pseudomonas putida]MDF3878194.1 AraC family transcriptional regulator [Pseudomonas putida]